MKVTVILPAAGLGTRMGRAVPEKAGTSRKQFMLLEGSPILLHTIRKFALTPAVSEIVVALRPEDIEWVRGLLRVEAFRKQKPASFVSWAKRPEAIPRPPKAPKTKPKPTESEDGKQP